MRAMRIKAILFGGRPPPHEPGSELVEAAALENLRTRRS